VRIPEGELESPVRYEDSIKMKALGSTEADLLHLAWCCVRVEPELHALEYGDQFSDDARQQAM